MAIRVILVQDQGLVRTGIRALISGDAQIEVVGEAENGRRALQLARELKPDVALMPVSMPELNSLNATARIARMEPRCAVIILSLHASEAYVLEALKAGAAGYLLKATSRAELRAAIRAVARGERYLSPVVSKYVIEAALRGGGAAASSAAQVLLAALTPRQREVLQLIAEGKSTREIAERLRLSEKTVEMHRAHVKTRLNIYDTAGLTRYAIRIGLVSAS